MNVIEEISKRPKPLDTATWWKQQTPVDTAGALEDEEAQYLALFSSEDIEVEYRIGRGIATSTTLTSEEQERARIRFGSGPASVDQFANHENRRRIIAHYTLTHPATIAYQLGLYRLTRDVNPVTFVISRLYQLVSGKEEFTDEEISRLKVGIELLLPVIVSRALRLAAGSIPTSPAIAPNRALTDPLWDLPIEGGGMHINGRWYTEHALERMAQDTVAIRATLYARTVTRLKRLGIESNSAVWDKCLSKAASKIDPRGIPPSVVEAEIMKPGSTNVKVITVKRGQVVVTVVPKRR